MFERGYVDSDKLNVFYLVLCRRGCAGCVAGKSARTPYFVFKTDTLFTMADKGTMAMWPFWPHILSARSLSVSRKGFWRSAVSLLVV